MFSWLKEKFTQKTQACCPRCKCKLGDWCVVSLTGDPEDPDWHYFCDDECFYENTLQQFVSVCWESGETIYGSSPFSVIMETERMLLRERNGYVSDEEGERLDALRDERLKNAPEWVKRALQKEDEG